MFVNLHENVHVMQHLRVLEAIGLCECVHVFIPNIQRSLMTIYIVPMQCYNYVRYMYMFIYGRLSFKFTFKLILGIYMTVCLPFPFLMILPSHETLSMISMMLMPYLMWF